MIRAQSMAHGQPARSEQAKYGAAAGAGWTVLYCKNRQPAAPLTRGKDTTMPLTVNKDVFITCALTGSGATQDRSPHVPHSPHQIAECSSEICTLDCGTMNFAEADYVMTNRPGLPRAMGPMMTDLGIEPEIEAFETGRLWIATELVREGVPDGPALMQPCMGVPWRAPDDLNTFIEMVNNEPEASALNAFSPGRHQMSHVAAAVLAGGNVRVGLEGTLWLGNGVLATSTQLVERAVGIIEGMGARVTGPVEVRAKLGLTKQATA